MQRLQRWLPGLLGASSHMPPQSLPQSRSLEQQWSNLETVVLENIDRAGQATRKHAVAALHLDAAHYTLSRIAEELSVAMPPIELRPAVVVSAAFPIAGFKPLAEEAIAA